MLDFLLKGEKATPTVVSFIQSYCFNAMIEYVQSTSIAMIMLFLGYFSIGALYGTKQTK
jgi:hypothetical protein